MALWKFSQPEISTVFNKGFLYVPNHLYSGTVRTHGGQNLAFLGVLKKSAGFLVLTSAFI